MSMKTSSEPRRVYTRNNVTHVLFAGSVYGPKGESEIPNGAVVKCEVSSTGKTCVVTRKRPGNEPTVETWYTVDVPTNHRS